MEQNCNHKPFVDTGNAPRMEGGRNVVVTRGSVGGVSLNGVAFGRRADYLCMPMAAKQ